MSTSGGTSGGGSGLQPANNLSDVASIATSRDNIAAVVTNRTFLRGDGTHATMAAIQAADVPTLNQNTSGTAAGLSATLAIASGGTNATTASAALSNLGGAPLASPTFTGTVTIPTTGLALGGVTSAALGETNLGLATLTNHGVVLAAGAGAFTALALDASVTKYLQSGGSSAGPAWATINVTDIPTAAPIASPTFTGTVTMGIAIINSISGAITAQTYGLPANTTNQRANGALGSETKILSGQTVGNYFFAGWNDTSAVYLNGAAITAVADQDYTGAGFRGTRLHLSTSTNSVATIPIVRLIIDNAGKIWVGATTGAAVAFIDQTGNASFNGTVAGASSILSSSASGGVGYATGAGGTVTQTTSKSQGVTLNKICGQITMNNANLLTLTQVNFTLTNSTIAATDVIVACISSGAAAANSYEITVDQIAAGSCSIGVRNNTAGTLSEALVINFAVIKAVTA